MLDPLLGAIERLHAEGVYHRDIAPDNIQIEPDGHPVLLDFGAARRVIGDKSQTLTAILKPAYAPIEQYGEAGSVKQGPWTDLYALGATLHYLLLLRPPPPATTRAVHDDAAPLASMTLPGCSENFLQIIDWMLAPRPADRPQSVAALRDALDGRNLAAAPPAVEAQPASQWEQTMVQPHPATTPPTPRDDDATMVLPRPRTEGTAAAPRTPPPGSRTPSPRHATAGGGQHGRLGVAGVANRDRGWYPWCWAWRPSALRRRSALWPRQAAGPVAQPAASGSAPGSGRPPAPASAAVSSAAAVTMAPCDRAAPTHPPPRPRAAPTTPVATVAAPPRNGRIARHAPAALVKPATRRRAQRCTPATQPQAHDGARRHGSPSAKPATAHGAPMPHPNPSRPRRGQTASPQGPEAKCSGRNPLVVLRVHGA